MKFGTFFSSYCENGEKKYLKMINELMKTTFLTLEVDFNDLESFDPDLANYTVLNPYDVEFDLLDGLKEIIDKFSTNQYYVMISKPKPKSTINEASNLIYYSDLSATSTEAKQREAKIDHQLMENTRKFNKRTSVEIDKINM